MKLHCIFISAIVRFGRYNFKDEKTCEGNFTGNDQSNEIQLLF